MATPTTWDHRSTVGDRSDWFRVCVACDEITTGETCTNPECAHGHAACVLCETMRPVTDLGADPESDPRDLFCRTCRDAARRTHEAHDR